MLIIKVVKIIIVEEVFDCFVEAVQSQWDYTRKEHEKTNDLFKRVLGDSK